MVSGEMKENFSPQKLVVSFIRNMEKKEVENRECLCFLTFSRFKFVLEKR